MHIAANECASCSSPLDPMVRGTSSRAIVHKDGSAKPAPASASASASPTIQARLDALNAAAAGHADDKSGSPDADDAANQTIITVNDLTAAWGTSEVAYDLNADGIVNVQDLLRLLAEGGTMRKPDAPVTLEGLRAAWGTSNASYDLNADGIVNVSDLLQLMAQTKSDDGADAALDAGNAERGDAAIADLGPITDPISAPGPALEKPAAAAVPIAPLTARAASADTTSTTLRGVADGLYERLAALGHERRPPANLHALLDHLNLARPDRQALLERLAERYPRGLGINRVG
jgi:hypothetical protein